MTISGELAARSEAVASTRDRERLRTRTASNTAAAVGDIGHFRTLLPALEGATASERALRLGIVFHARTQDDFYPAGRCHVGAVVAAAALALADQVGERWLDCLAAGYRVICTVSAVYSSDAQRRGLRPTGLFGPLGAAATAARALNFDREHTAAAISMAAALCGGTNQAWLDGSDEWAIQCGVAARVGVEAALLVAAGAAAAPHALEGPAGWAAAFFEDHEARRLQTALGSDLDLSGVAVKAYPISGIGNVPTWLACRMHDTLGGAVFDEAELTMCAAEASYPGSNTGQLPTTRAAALMSLAFCVACGLADGRVRLSRLNDPASLAGLTRRVRVVADPALAETEAQLRVRADGRWHELIGAGEQLLYPTWESTRANPHELAARSEAVEDVVGSLVSELASPEPDARALSAIVNGVCD